MTTAPTRDRPRTLLAQLLRERRWSVEDFRRHYEAASLTVPDGRRQMIGDRQAKRWLSGTLTGRPYPAACLVLERLFDHSIEDLLAPPPAESPNQLPALTSVPPTRAAHARPLRASPPPQGRARPQAATPASAVDAEDAFYFLARAENTPSPEILALLWNEVRRLANAYGDHLALLVDDLTVARKAIFRLLDGPTDPGLREDLPV